MDGTSPRGRGSRARGTAAGTVVFALPLVGLISLLLRSQLDPHFENYPAHFVVFGLIGGIPFALRFAAGEDPAVRGGPRGPPPSPAVLATRGGPPPPPPRAAPSPFHPRHPGLPGGG